MHFCLFFLLQIRKRMRGYKTIFIKIHKNTSRFLIRPENRLVCRRVRARFSPEQVDRQGQWMVNIECSRRYTRGDRDPRRWGKRKTVTYLTLHCHHQNDSALQLAALKAILMSPSLWGTRSQNSEGQGHKTVRDKVTRQCPQRTTLEEKGKLTRGFEPTSSAYQPNALPLGQSGSNYLSPAWIYQCLQQ